MDVNAAPLKRRPTWPALVSGDRELIRQCEDDACGWLFVDRSRGGRRRWCSMADCGNRAKARRHYTKLRT